MEAKGLILFSCFMIGLLTSGVAAGILAMNGGISDGTTMLWISLAFFLANGGSWYMLGVKISQYDKEEGNE